MFPDTVLRRLAHLTVQGWGYSIATLDSFLLALFDKYAELLKRRFSEDFQEVSAFSVTTKGLTLNADVSDCVYRRLHAHGDQLTRRIREGDQRQLVRARPADRRAYVCPPTRVLQCG